MSISMIEIGSPYAVAAERNIQDKRDNESAFMRIVKIPAVYGIALQEKFSSAEKFPALLISCRIYTDQRQSICSAW